MMWSGSAVAIITGHVLSLQRCKTPTFRKSSKSCSTFRRELIIFRLGGGGGAVKLRNVTLPSLYRTILVSPSPRLFSTIKIQFLSSSHIPQERGIFRSRLLVLNELQPAARGMKSRIGSFPTWDPYTFLVISLNGLYFLSFVMLWFSVLKYFDMTLDFAFDFKTAVVCTVVCKVRKFW